MIKLIASDMDGTLLDSNKKINPEFNSIMEELNNDGIIFVAISGRESFSLKHVFREIKGDIFYASNNGNLIEYKDKILFENYIEKEKVEKISKVIRKCAKHNTIYCGKDVIYSESILPGIIGKKFGLKVKYVRDINKVEDNIIKITTFGNDRVVKKAHEILKEFNEELMVTPSGKYSMDICKLGGNKKNAVEILQKILDVNYEETMVIGDHLNDLEMMEAAYYSFAMGNAKEEVKEKARFIAKTNDENGVIEAIKSMALSQIDYKSSI